MSQSEQHPTTYSLVLLATKLIPPRLPLRLVQRSRLLHLLDAALSQPITLLSAAAGWGKTTLLSLWATTQTDRLTWLSLDELDNEPTRFWRSLLTALRTRLPTVGETPFAMLASSEPPPLTAVLTVLLNDLSNLSTANPLVLILDDYYWITDASIHEGMIFLIDHLPPGLHIVLATRADPELPLARWRVRGELVEIRAADLRFTAEEAAAFFNQSIEPELTKDEIALLEARTAGWAAGLQLAALVLRQQPDRTTFVQHFTGSHRYLLDYVQEEILQRQPVTIQRFLLRTAVLNRLHTQVCTALTDDPDSQAMLEWLDRHNLLVTPLDEVHQWYRLHDLWREVLLARLHTTEPTLIPILHGRAARWFAGQNEWRQAIPHALAAEDFAYAADLIAQAAPSLWLNGEAQTVHRWLDALPDAVLLAHARLVLEAVLTRQEMLHATVKIAYNEGQRQVEQTVARLDVLLRTQSEPHLVPAAEQELLGRRIWLLRALLRVRTLLVSGDANAMRLLVKEVETIAEQEEIRWQIIGLSIQFWYVETFQRQGGLLLPKLLTAKHAALAAGKPAVTSRVLRMLAVAWLRAGQLHKLHATCLEGLVLAEQSGEQTATLGYLYYFLSHVQYVWNQLPTAAAHLRIVLQIAQTWQQADLAMVGNLDLSYLLLRQGDWAAANQALQQAEQLVAQEQFATHAATVTAMRADFWLATGNITAATTWAQGLILSHDTWHPNRKFELLVLVRAWLAMEQPAQALRLLEEFRPQMDQPGSLDIALHFLVLEVVALHANQQPEAASAVLLCLLDLALPGEAIRIFVDAGEPMKRMLQSLLDSYDLVLTPAMIAYIHKLLTAFDQQTPSQQTTPAASMHLPAPHSPVHPVVSTATLNLLEPLTRREEEVLHLLAAGASNQEIATQLVISLATVKKHVGNVLGKLGVTTRSQAIVRLRTGSSAPALSS